MKKIIKKGSDIVFLLLACLSQIKTNLFIKTFQKRFRYFKMLGIFPKYEKHEKVLFLIAHIVPQVHNLDGRIIHEKTERLQACIESIIEHQSHLNFKIKILVLKDTDLIEFLPDYQKEFIEIEIIETDRPMYGEYEAYSIFEKYQHDFDFYVFLEDDILLMDSFFIEKTELFNRYFSNTQFLLFPHRYEMYEGKKFFVDQIFFYPEEKPHYRMLESSVVDINGFKFSEFENPHAGFYCLNKGQLLKWILSANLWKGKEVAFGPLESAATFAHFENFKIFNPHPDNINYFEVKHYGSKYSRQHFEREVSII